MDKSCSFYQVVGGSNPTRPTLYDTPTERKLNQIDL